jgi:uncharacterized protein YgiM (DUF1202 family)
MSLSNRLPLLVLAFFSIVSAIIAGEKREVIANVANVRNGPGTHYSVIYKLDYGSIITVLERKNGWIQIVGRTYDEEAWILESLTAEEGYIKNTTQEGTEGRSKYLNYNYFWCKSEGKVAVTFSPFLPRDDTVVIGAMLDVIGKVYGKHRVTDLNPKVVSRGGTNVVLFSGITEDYLFLIFKEDTGEVHSFTLWTE